GSAGGRRVGAVGGAWSGRPAAADGPRQPRMGGRGRRVGRRIGPGSFVVRGRFEVVGRILICPRGGPVGGTRSGPRVRIEGGHRPAHGRGGRTARLERRPAG